MRLTSAHSSPRDYVAPSSPPWWCPTIAPPRRLSPPRALFTADLAGTRAPRKRERRKQSGGGRFIALERLGYYLRTALHEFILSLAYKFEICVVQIVDWWEIIIVLFGGLWRNQVWKWHLARTLCDVFWKKNGFVYLIFTMNTYLNRIRGFRQYSKSLEASGVCSCSTFPYVSHSPWNDVRGIETSATYVETRTNRDASGILKTS